ncbi:MAG TPA: PVC-type heme-binding CxxCH protein [Candidatus Limnocylindria bacterium]|jgi:putative membrane-bound dehydrogenase-like protein|nr:PVC-type heme-binding CxxCH protein [Candidatus Limnocylindria bacterium]
MPASVPSWFVSLAACLSAIALDSALHAQNFPEPTNSQLGVEPMTPAEAAKSFHLPEGFQVSVFAAEPDVRQPIAMTTDARGRLWVAENYTYGDTKENYRTDLNDRVLIFEDTDNDGHFDKRTIFWDQAKILTSVEVGMGGVFLLCPPQLLFVPDRNADGVPDGKPEVVLDGFDNVSAGRHTFPNGLKWGPDGWLWGRIGISTGAHVGPPGASAKERVEMRGGIWRYHPQRHVVEAVSHGTTNPWGLDWNEVGEPFFINTVIGHLWHAIPGAHFRRMHGEDVNPHSYILIDQHADHYHFDTGAGWTKSRAASDGSFAAGSDNLGGGHAHAGLMIYQGENWPEQYRGQVFTLNLHGRRINQDRLERDGSGYVGRHGADLLSIGDPWFRGLDLIAGPDGGVYIADWSDTGECHENDGVHRTSGRIYKVTYGTPAKPGIKDLTQLADADLVPLVLDHNEWYSRQSRRLLADHHAAGANSLSTAGMLQDLYSRQTTSPGKLRALWALNAVGGASTPWLLQQTRSGDEYVRSWAVRLLTDWWAANDLTPAATVDIGIETPLDQIRDRFHTMSVEDRSALVRLYLASSIQRVSKRAALEIATGLLGRTGDEKDHNLGLLLWYGLEPLVAADPNEGVILAKASKFSVIKQLVTRRLAETIPQNPRPITEILAAIQDLSDAEKIPYLYGLANALKGLRKCPMPPGWDTFSTRALAGGNREIVALVNSIAIVFGDGRPLEQLRTVATNIASGPLIRKDAIGTLVDNQPENLAPLLRSLLGDAFVRAPAMVGLLKLGDTNAPQKALEMFGRLDSQEKGELMAALVLRPASAHAVLDAMAAGQLSKNSLTPVLARQIASLNDPKISKQLGEVWGSVRATEDAKIQQMAKIRQWVTSSGKPVPDLTHGRLTFDRICAGCHRLYDKGKDVGPNLTGSGRANLDYLLSNIVDPNGLVPGEYKMTVLTLKDGRVLNGITRRPSDLSVTLQTATDAVTVDRKDIESMEQSDQSMMPEGLLDTLKETEVRDLLAYLMADHQVALPTN